jgi:mannose-1-phosphate guanylyltransferase
MKFATGPANSNRVRAVSAIPAARQRHTWSIVLAGGEGERLRLLTERWLGIHRPKQYCAFVGRRSMLQHTLDRAVRLSGADRTLVVVAKQHAPDVWQHLDKVHWQQTLLQPRNCGTAPGIFLPLAHICARDPEAIVVILPSDHFVFPEDAFQVALRRVALAACRLPDKLVLLGACADRPETKYG